MIPSEVPTQSRGTSCWTIGLLSCLGAAALIIAGLAILFIYVARRPEFKQAMSAGTQMATCQTNLQEIHAAIERYRQRSDGQYPKSLNELVPRYLEQAGTLKCPADVSGEPVSYKYMRPAKDSPPTTPLLECDNHQVMNQNIPIIVLKNGQVLGSREVPLPSEDNTASPKNSR